MSESSSDLVISVLRPILEPCAKQLVALVENTGLQWGKTPRESFWYRRPEWHIFELIAFTCIISSFYIYTRPFWRVATGRVSALSPSNAAQAGGPKATTRTTRNADGEKMSIKHASPAEALSVSPAAIGSGDVAVGAYSKVDRIQSIMYFLILCSQVYIKASRPKPLVQICWLTMPCHFITLGWTYVLGYTGGILGRRGTNNVDQMPWLRSMATMLIMCLWGPVFAVMFPDWEDHLYSWEGPVFLIHHALLMLTPIYWAARYRMLSFSKEILLVLVSLSCAINFWICTPLAYLSGLNVNYHLHPPTKVAHTVVFRSQWYRFTVVSLLATSATIGWCFSALVSRVLRMALGLRRGTFVGERDVNAGTVHHTLQPELPSFAGEASPAVGDATVSARGSVVGRPSIVASAQSKKKD